MCDMEQADNILKTLQSPRIGGAQFVISAVLHFSNHSADLIINKTKFPYQTQSFIY